MPNNLAFKDLLYQMGRDYSVSVRYGRIVTQDLNYDTGVNTVTKTVIDINRIIYVPSKLHRRFVQDIAYLAANKNFTYGGLFDENYTIFVLDARQVPINFQPQLDDFIFYNKQRYHIKSVHEFEFGVGWTITCMAHLGANPFDQVPASLINQLNLQQEISYDLS